MCGIVGYIGHREAYPIVLKGLKRLEYRGYDSTGVAIIQDGQLQVHKKKGKVAELEEAVVGKNMHSHICIGHTRWATHGEPSDRNAHPHLSNNGRLAMLHNGIIENYTQIKTELLSKGYTFKSDTDTEVLLNFIQDIQENNNSNLEEALRIALKRIVGAYCILLIDQEDPETIIAARKGSPLVIGIGKDEHFLASDASPIIEYTKEVVYVNDYEIAIVKKDELILKNLGNEKQTPFIQKLDMELAAIEKGGYDHFMLKEVFEQPATIFDCLRGRLLQEQQQIVMAGVDNHLEALTKASRIMIVACGTSWHAGLVAEYMIEELCRIPVEVEYASEFRYRNPVIHPGDVIIAISQSGETADTLVALESAKEKGAFIFGVVNAVGSSIARLSHAGAYTHAGPEIAVASTKALLTQIIAVYLIGLHLGQVNGSLKDTEVRDLYKELLELPGKIEQILETVEPLRELTRTFAQNNTVLFLGRNIGYPVALEGALKLKELAYIHAEGFAGGELKHGPIALIDQGTPVIAILPAGHEHSLDEKMLSNIQEVKARGARVIVIAEEGAHVEGAEHVIRIPVAPALFQPVLATVPLQVFAYEMAVVRGNDVDQPRNLAKSVTVE